MTFQDRTQPDPSQPLTLDRPQSDPSVQPPYPHPQYQRAQMPPALFIPNTSRPPTDPSNWGGDHAPIQAASMYPGMSSGPDMPSGFESYPTIARGAGYAAKWGSDNINQEAGRVSGLAMAFAPLLDMLSKGGFSRGFNASSLNSIKVQQQRLILEGEQLQQRHAQEMTDYGSIIAKADSLVKEHPERAAEIIADAREELRFLADIKYRHHPLTAVIDSSGGLDAAKNFLNQEHAQFLDYWSGLTSLKKVAGTDDAIKEADEWGEPRPSTGTGGGTFRPLDTPEERAEEGGPQAPGTPSGGDFNDRLARNMKLSPQEMRAIDQEVASGKPGPDIAAVKSPDIKRKVGLGVAAKNAEIDRIANDPNMGYDDKMREITKLNQNAANHIRGLIDLSTDPKEPGIPNRSTMAQRAEAISKSSGSPGPFSQASFGQMKEYFTPTVSREIIRASSMGQAVVNVLGALKPFDENESNIQRKLEAYFAKELTGADDKYIRLFDSLADYANHFFAVESGTGVPRVTPLRDWMKEVGAANSPWQIRAAIQQNLSAALQVVNTHQGQWERIKPNTLMPWISPHDYRVIRAVVRGNSQTGEMPAKSPREVLAVSKDPGQSRKEANRLSPLTMQQIREDYLPRIAQWQNSPDPALRAKAQAARERIGNVIGIERRIPQVDDPNAGEE